MKKRQEWFCGACNKSGAVEYEEPGNNYYIGYQIYKMHGEMSPQCPNPSVTLEFSQPIQKAKEGKTEKLNSWAKEFVRRAEVESGGFFLTGMHNETESVRKYVFPDRSVVYETIQVEFSDQYPWYWFALKDEKGRWLPYSLRTQEEINEVETRDKYIIAVREGSEVKELKKDPTDYNRP